MSKLSLHFNHDHHNLGSVFTSNNIKKKNSDKTLGKVFGFVYLFFVLCLFDLVLLWMLVLVLVLVDKLASQLQQEVMFN